MEVSDAKRGRKGAVQKRFAAILKSEMSGEAPREIIASVNPKLSEYVGELSQRGERVTLARAVNMALILKALGGDLKSYETLRDTLGEKPEEADTTKLGGIKIVIEDADNS